MGNNHARLLTIIIPKNILDELFLICLMIADVHNIKGRPLAGSAEETAHFKKLQESFVLQYKYAFPDMQAAKTVVVVPSLSLDREMLEKISGHIYYEERMLCLLMLLKMPNTHIIYISSMPIDPVIIDYYLHLLPGITSYHARQRLTLLSCYDSSTISLTEKILQRPHMMERIRQHIPPHHAAHMVCFNVTAFEKTLAVQLGIPVYGADPDHYFIGTKSGSRQIFRKLGLAMPEGKENLHTEKELIDALYELKIKKPALKKAVIKLNDAFSGEGNAVFNYTNLVPGTELKKSIEASLPYNLIFIAEDLSKKIFFEKFQLMGGIVEEFIDGIEKTSPSVQCRIDPLGGVHIISTHDQVLGGDQQQVFIGATFPANQEYAVELGNISTHIANELAARGVLGRFSIDYISVKEGNRWKHYAIEINLRKGGTTHPYLMLQFLTDGKYQSKTGKFFTATGQERFYFATDNVKPVSCKGLTPPDLIDIAMKYNLLYNGSTQEGVMFHMISALSQYGKMGIVCIGSSHERAADYFSQTLEVLEKEGKNVQ
jgi:hypothetical protein